MKRNVLTSLERIKFTLTDQLKQILVGLLLGDLYAQKRGKMGNTVFRFEQGTVSFSGHVLMTVGRGFPRPPVVQARDIDIFRCQISVLKRLFI
jgi:hypothetical protein